MLRAWRSRSAAFVLPVALASGCLLVAPPEDLPASGGSGSGSGARGGGGGNGGSTVMESGGSGAVAMLGGQAGDESSSVGGSSASGGNAGGGEGGVGESGGRGGTSGNAARGGVGGKGASGGKAGSGTTGGTGGSSEPAGGMGQGGASECSTNEECSNAANVPRRCRPSDHTCVNLQTNECLLVAGPYTDPNALYIGAFAVIGTGDPTDNDVYLAYRLAVDEINAAGGLPGGPGGAPRKLVLIVCTNDESEAPNAISLSMTHLAEQVQVPAIIAMLQPDDLNKAFSQEVEQELFFLNPVATVRSLTDSQFLSGKGAKGDVLLWTLLGQPSDYAPAYSLLLSDLENQVRTERGLMSTDPIKVALVTTTDKFSNDLRFYTFQSLMFNGTSAANEAQVGNYYELNNLDPTSLPSQQQLDDLLAFEPDIVISTAGDVMTTAGGVLPELETSWTSSKPRPYYLLSPYNASSDATLTIENAVLSEVGAEPHVARRFLGVTAAPAADLTLENAYETRYYAQWQSQKAPAAANTDNFYDAVYYLAYAIYAADSLTGPGIANGMKRLITGPSYDDGPDEIGYVFGALNGGGSISLNSTLGPPDFDATTGVRPVTPGVFCFTYNGHFQARPNTLRYDPTQNKFTGTYPCEANIPSN